MIKLDDENGGVMHEVVRFKEHFMIPSNKTLSIEELKTIFIEEGKKGVI